MIIRKAKPDEWAKLVNIYRSEHLDDEAKLISKDALAILSQSMASALSYRLSPDPRGIRGYSLFQVLW